MGTLTKTAKPKEEKQTKNTDIGGVLVKKSTGEGFAVQKQRKSYVATPTTTKTTNTPAANKPQGPAKTTAELRRRTDTFYNAQPAEHKDMNELRKQAATVAHAQTMIGRSEAMKKKYGVEQDQDALSMLEQLAAAKTALDSQIDIASHQNDNFLQRLGNTGLGGLKQSAGSNIENIGNLGALLSTANRAAGGFDTRIAQEGENRQNYRKQLADVQSQITNVGRRAAYTGSAQDTATVQELQKQAERLQMLIDRTYRRQEGEENLASMETADIDKAVQAAYDYAGKVSQSGAMNIERAKSGTSQFWQDAIDAGASSIQSAVDGAIGAVTGSGMIPFVARSFGGASQQMRLENPNAGTARRLLYGTAQATKEYITEKLFGLTGFGKLVTGGGGSVDEFVENGIANAVKGIAKTEAGQKFLGGLMTLGAGTLGEAAEEGIGDLMELPIDYFIAGKKLPQTEDELLQFVEDVARDMFVGGLSGMFGGTLSPSTYRYNPDAVLSNYARSEQSVDNGVPSVDALIDALNNTNGEQDARAALEALARGETFTTQERSFTPASENAVTGQETAENEAQQSRIEREFPNLNRYMNEKQADIDIEPVAQTLGENGRKAMRKAFENGAQSVEAVREFTQVYNAASDGREAPATRSLSEAQRFMAQASGENDAAAIAQSERGQYNQTNNMSEEGENNEVYLRDSGERDGSQNSGRPLSGMEEAAGRDQSGSNDFARSAADGGAAQLSYGGYRTAAEEGISNAYADGGKLYFDVQGDTESTRAAREIAEAHGYKLTLFAGGNLQLVGSDGKAFEARAFVDPDNKVMYVRADHERYTSDQLTRHEEGHIKIDNGEIDLENVRADLQQRFTPEQLKGASDRYAQAYDGSGLTADDIFTEVVCDSLGDMNIFGGTEFGENTVAPVLSAAKQSANEQTANGTRGPPSGTKTSRDDGDSMTKAKKALLSYNAMIGKPSMKLTQIDDSATFANTKQDRKKIVQDSLSNAQSIGTIMDDGRLYIRVEDTGRDIRLTNRSLYHGLDRRMNQNAAVTLYAGEILKNSILINELTPRSDDIEASYVYLGAAQGTSGTVYVAEFVTNQHSGELENINVLYSVNAKKESATQNASGVAGNPLAITNSEVSISQLLKIASEKFPDVLPESVLKHFGMGGRPDGKIGNDALYSREVDSDGHKLSEQQQKYFNDSKVVDANGRLKVMYQGGSNDFTVFDRKKSKYSNLYGRGFYFTDSETHAKQYGDARAFYLNIKNPVSTTETTITKAQLRKFLKAVAADEDEYSFENYGEYATVDSVLKSVYGKSDFAMLFDINQTAIGDMVSAVELFNKVNGTSYDGLILDTETVTFSSEQAKNIDNVAPTENPDIRYSREVKGAEELREENAALREKLDELKDAVKVAQRKSAQAEYWKGQTKLTTEPTLRQGDVDKFSHGIIKGYSSTLKTSDINERIKSLGEYMLRGTDGKNELTYGEVKDRAVDIARDIVTNAKALVDSEHEELYREVKSLLKRKISITNTTARDIPDFNEWRKRYFNTLGVGVQNGGTAIDVVYSELSDMAPWLFPNDITNPTDMLLQMADSLDSMRAVYENPHSAYMADAIEYCANDIIDGLMDETVRQNPQTFADRQAFKLQEQKAKDARKLEKLREQKNERIAEIRKQGRENAKQAVAAAKAQRDEQIAKMKQHYADVAEAKRERKADSAARTRLLHIVKRLKNKKLPAVNRALLNQYIGDLDTVSKSMTGKTVQKLTDLQAWYANEKETNPDFIADPAIEKMLTRLSQRHISDLTNEEVADLTTVLLNIENEIRTQRKTIDTEDRRDTYFQGLDVIRDVEQTKGSKTGVAGIPGKYIVTETLSPVRQLHRMTGYNDADPLYLRTQELADGQRKMLDYQMKASKPFNKYASDKAFNKMFSGKDAETIKVTGLNKNGPTEVEITPAMRVSLYLHSLNDQNLKHIAGGGITVPDAALYRKGELAEAYARGTTIKLTPSQVRSITSRMTTQERAFANEVSHYFNVTSKESINAVSEKLKGYSLAEVENYFPIEVNEKFSRKKTTDTLQYDGTIEGMGFLKERINASSPIYLRDVNMVLDKSIQMHSKYVGMAIPVRNFCKVIGITKASFDADGNRTDFLSSVQETIGGKWGEDGLSYIDNMLTDVQGGSRTRNKWGAALAKVRSKYAGAVLTLNLSVAAKQAASYPTAGAVLGWRPLMRAMSDFGKVDLDTIAKYTPLQWYRSQGFSTKELGDLKKSDSILNNLPPALNWVQGMDVITTRKLWKASEYYVREHSPSLGVGTDAYYQEVARMYNRVIEETQPNYTTMQRPQLLRTDDPLLANLAMFKTQPFQNFNILYDAFANYEAKRQQNIAGGTADTKAALTSAKRDLGNAVTSQIAQLAVFAGMTMAWAMFRGRDDDWKDEDGEYDIGKLMAALGKNMVSGVFSIVPFGSEAWDAVSAKVFNTKYYGFDAVAVEAVVNTVKSMDKMLDTVVGITKNAANGEDIDWQRELVALDDEIDDISKVLGVPYENVANLFIATYRWAAIGTQGEYMGRYSAMKFTQVMRKKSSSAKRGYTINSAYYDLLYDAKTHDTKAYNALYKQMLADGIEASDLDKAMKSRSKK